jgi:predicted nucleic acid-binding protein
MIDMVIVPDASVLLKWSLDSPAEKDQEKARAIRQGWLAGRHRIVLPSIWGYEVGNILGRKQARLARELLEIYFGYGFEEERAADLYERAFDIMNAIEVTFYDAAYHAVALKHRGIYISADDKYVRKAFPLGHVIALRDWVTK